MTSRARGRDGRTSPALAARIRSAKSQSSLAAPIRIYLILYNAISAVAWAALGHHVYETWASSGPAALPSRTVKALCMVQTLAVLEVLHVLLGLVPSQLLSTVMQIATRLFVAWVPGYYFVHNSILSPWTMWGYVAVVVAWTLSDLTRYIYYTVNLLGLKATPLLWCRYTFFLLLYPVGTAGEMAMIWAMRSALAAASHRYTHALTALLGAYPPGFLFMYNHMLNQRKKYIK